MNPVRNRPAAGTPAPPVGRAPTVPGRPVSDGMNQLGINRAALRVKEARFGRWFSGSKRLIWWGLLIIDLAIGVWLWQQGRMLYNLFWAAALGKSLLLLWHHWYLAELPIRPRGKGAEFKLEEVIEGNLLAAASRAASPRQLWQAAQSQWQARFIINRLGLEPEAIIGSLSDNPAELASVWQLALEIAQKLGLPSIDGGVLEVALIISLPNSQNYLDQLGLSRADLLGALRWQKRVEHRFMSKNKPVFGGIGRDWAFGYIPLLNRFGANLSRQVEGGVFRLNLGIHEPAVAQIINVLSQPVKNSVALVGQAGAGKTTLAYLVAQYLIEGNAPAALRYDQVIALNASVLIAQAGNRGELEGLMLALIGEAARAKNIILFFDDAQLFFSDATGGVNLANVLLPILQNSATRLIIAISPSQWQKLMASHPELSGLLNYQAISEPDEATTLATLEDQAITIEAQTGSLITYQAIREAHALAERYEIELANPGKSIKVLLAAANSSPGGRVSALTVQQSIENTLGVKVGAAGAREKSQLLNLEAELHKQMVNQSYAVQAVADALRRARAGVKSPNRPSGSFLFLGPTGVGKTQLAKALAAVYFGGTERIIRVDMSEYANRADSKRLLQPSSAGQSFLMQLRTQPFSVVLLDEIEKAHPEVLNLLLQMLDEGNLTDSEGRKVSFKDAIIIATSNAGADEIRNRIDAGEAIEKFSAQFIDNLISSKRFLPELINRFDEVVLFRPLLPAELKQVVGLMLGEINQELGKQKIKVVLSPDAEDWLVANGNDPRLGARPLRRTIQRTVESMVAKRILEGSVKAGQVIELNAADLQSAGEAQVG